MADKRLWKDLVVARLSGDQMMNDDDEFFGEETNNLKELKSWKSLHSPLWTGLLISSSDRFRALIALKVYISKSLLF